MSPRLAFVTAVALLVSTLSLVACAAPVPEDAPSGSGSTGAVSCAKDSLAVKTKGTFTIGTDKPAYGPWFADDNPSNGKGYESAVGFAIASKLGFTASEVKWIVVPFNSVIAPGAKSFDIDLNQVSISPERKNAVDFSSGYYDVRQAVITYQGSPIAGKTKISELANAKLGAQVGTTSYKAATEQIKPTKQVAVYDSNDLAVQALKNKQLDGIVVDVPTAFFMTTAQLDDGLIVGQLPAAGGQPEQFGAVLDKGSALTSCVTQAVDALRRDATLDKLEQQWLATRGAPELT